MSQGKKVKGTKEKKKVKGWSTEEIKDKASSSLVEDTEAMRTWRSLNQEEMDQRWKNWAERIEVEVLDKCEVGTATESLQRRRLLFGMDVCAKKQEIQDEKVERRLLCKNFRLFQRLQPSASAQHASGFDGRKRDGAAEKNEDYEGFYEED